jgi:hypothetical protein
MLIYTLQGQILRKFEKKKIALKSERALNGSFFSVLFLLQEFDLKVISGVDQTIECCYTAQL